MGYLPSALLNFMAFTGWNPGGEREIYTLLELIELFDVTKIHKGGAIFNTEKLAWMNKEHVRLESKESQLHSISEYFKEYSPIILEKLLPTIIDRISVYGELASLEEPEFRFFSTPPRVDIEKVIWKDSEKSEAKMHLDALSALLTAADFSSPVSLKESIMPYAELHGKGNVLWPLRVTLSGQEKSVDPFTICYVIGKEETLMRITSVSKALNS
jgi:glutamyl-tRNA synthetase